MREVNSIIVVLKCDRPSERIEMKVAFSLDRILVVAHLASISHPSLFVSLGLNLRVHERLHPMIVETIWLEQIDNIKLVRLACSRVADPKIEPLSLALDQEVRTKN